MKITKEIVRELIEAGANAKTKERAENLISEYTLKYGLGVKSDQIKKALGFDVDLDYVIKLFTDDEIEPLVDSLYGMNYITITKVSFNDDRSVVRKMTVEFTADIENMEFSGLSFTIDNFGRVLVSLGDSPWEGGSAEFEMLEILMKYVTKQKYL